MAKTGDTWGPWTYDAEAQTLTIMIGGNTAYPVRVDEIIGNPRELADWLAQLAEKTWMDAPAMGQFVYALDAIIKLRSLAM